MLCIERKFEIFVVANFEKQLYTFLSKTTEKRPRKLTRKRKPIIQCKLGFLILFESLASVDCLAIASLIPKR